MTPQQEELLHKFTTLFREGNNFDRLNGFEFEILKPGEVQYQFTVKEEHQSAIGVAHGGVLASLMDATIGVAALSAAVVEEKLVATVEFKINYLAPIKPGDRILGKGVVDYKGKSLIVGAGTLLNRDTQQMIAKGMGTFNSYPMSKKEELHQAILSPIE